MHFTLVTRLIGHRNLTKIHANEDDEGADKDPEAGAEESEGSNTQAAD
jgi:hypothetical protein